MAGLPVTEEELRSLLVTRLELLDGNEFDKARRMAARLRVPLERTLVERSRIPFGFLLKTLAESWGVGFTDLKVSEVRWEALQTLPEEYARAHLLVPFERGGKELKVAMWDPRSHAVIDEIRRKTGLRVVPYLSADTAIRRAHLLYKADLRALLEQAAAGVIVPTRRPGRGEADDSSIVQLLNRILEYAAVSRASDIHIEPYELEIVVRCRIDGALQEILSLPPQMLPGLTSRIKVLSRMRLDEQRVPQDGRFEADLGGLKLDLRVSSLPTLWGEKLVLRVLPKEAIPLDLEDLGLAPPDYAIVLRNILRPFGMILITGPTGSGKSTTLYAMLSRLGIERQNVVNISTIEDPVEYTLPRVNQVPLNLETGLNFSAGLRSLLRQDPDIIMVGEIRDSETAEIAVRTALVGRLLLSTLHTNDAVGAVPRLLDMGVEPFLLTSTLSLVIAQRLVRRICLSCRESVALDASVLKALKARSDFDESIHVLQAQGVLSAGRDPLGTLRLFRGKGCPQCGGSGFRGRVGLFELFEIDDEIRRMTMERRDAATLRRAAVAKGMKTMFQDGLAKVLLGDTTLDEVVRVAV